MAKTAVKTSASEYGSERDLPCSELRWDSQADALKGLFAAVWGGHRITGMEYFAWQFLEGPKGRPIAHCARPDDAAAGALAGVYLVTPGTLLAGTHTLEFSTSVYTATHPDYQRRGIFGRLAELTYDKCSREGIAGTVGVPNNNSLPGFRRLGFQVLGSMEVLVRTASPFGARETDPRVREFESLRDFDAYRSAGSTGPGRFPARSSSSGSRSSSPGDIFAAPAFATVFSASWASPAD